MKKALVLVLTVLVMFSFTGCKSKQVCFKPEVVRDYVGFNYEVESWSKESESSYSYGTNQFYVYKIKFEVFPQKDCIFEKAKIKLKFTYDHQLGSFANVQNVTAPDDKTLTKYISLDKNGYGYTYVYVKQGFTTNPAAGRLFLPDLNYSIEPIYALDLDDSDKIHGYVKEK